MYTPEQLQQMELIKAVVYDYLKESLKININIDTHGGDISNTEVNVELTLDGEVIDTSESRA